MTADLIEFLHAALDKEQLAARIVSGPNSIGARWARLSRDTTYDHHKQPVALGVWGPFRCGVGEHIARYDPDRVLAEIDAKRRIVEIHGWSIEAADTAGFVCITCDPEDHPCATLRLLALPYAGHAGYRPEWAPQ